MIEQPIQKCGYCGADLGEYKDWKWCLCPKCKAEADEQDKRQEEFCNQKMETLKEQIKDLKENRDNMTTSDLQGCADAIAFDYGMDVEEILSEVYEE